MDSFERARPVLECMGKNIVHCGDSGAGQATKICNNMMLAIEMIGTSEALQLGRRWVWEGGVEGEGEERCGREGRGRGGRGEDGCEEGWKGRERRGWV